MDQKTITDHIRSATCNVLSTMLGLNAEPGPARLEGAPPVPQESVVSLIGLAGEFAGTGSISCSAEFACKMSSLMLMTDVRSVDGEVLDAVAEVANMVIGNIKTSLEEELGPMGMSIPTIIFGKNFTARSAGDEAWTTVPFVCDGDVLEVRLCLVPNRGSHKTRRPGFTPAYSLER